MIDGMPSTPFSAATLAPSLRYAAELGSTRDQMKNRELTFGDTFNANDLTGWF
jgi:hypothetical protein